MAAWDWYATFASLAGQDWFDRKAERAGLPSTDSYNMWPVLSGETETNPREHVWIGDVLKEEDTRSWGVTTVGGMILRKDVHLFKLILGMGEGETVRCASDGDPMNLELNFTAKRFPTADFCSVTQRCDRTPENGCLFDVNADPGEKNNLAEEHHIVFNEMLRLMDEEGQTVLSEFRGLPKNSDMCTVGFKDYNSFWGPWLHMPEGYSSAS